MDNHRSIFSSGKLTPYLSPLGVWALAFGCAVGWGSFIMPGTTFLPTAGPVGSIIGLLIGALVMIVIGANFRTMMNRYPDAGGAYTFASKVLGSDHGFLCAWMLILTYAAVIWANSTALSLIVRSLFGNVLCVGFSYRIFGYTVYLGEVLLAGALIVITGLVCLFFKRAAAVIQIICSIGMLVCIFACFIAVLIRHGGFSKLTPAFAAGSSPAVQILGIVMLAPWAFIGFESISHSAEEFRFPAKKTFGIMIAAIVIGALDYIMFTVCAGLAVPDNYAGWGEYIASLGSLNGLKAIPTFFAAHEALGHTGLILLGFAAICGILTALIGYYIALSRLLNKLARDNVFRHLDRVNRQGVPYTAIIAIIVFSCLIALLGRSAIGWIVDVTTIGALIVYTYVSLCSFIIGKREGKLSTMIFGGIGAVFSLILTAFFILPALWKSGVLAPESYLILILWSLLGMIVSRMLIRRDSSRQMGKSDVVWVILLVLILLISFIWVNQTITNESQTVLDDIHAVHLQEAQETGEDVDSELFRASSEKIDTRIDDFDRMTHVITLVQNLLILVSVIIIFSIYSLIKKREKQIEEEKLLAEQNSRAKTTFLSNMSHDIRTPMNAIIGYTSLAKKEDIPDKVRDYLEKIEYSGNHLLLLINDILDMSRIESGKVELEIAPVALCALAEGLEDMFSLQMQTKSIAYTVDRSGIEDCFVLCDKNQLTRLLLNLISNAYKFTPEGGSVTVTIRQTGRRDNIADYVFTVADTGIGMSPEFAKTVFNAFERERTGTVSKIQGTGLGMSIAKSLVELMGGTIRVDTQKGKGTVFTVSVSFPVADREQIEEQNAAGSAVPAEMVDFTGVRLLLAEDNPINSEIACAILGGFGFTVDVAEDGRQAVEMIAAAPDAYKAILMDIQMPVMNGYDATRAIRGSQGEYSAVPIIAVTANSYEEDRRAAIDAGMNDYVTKPFVPDRLIATLAKWIDLSSDTPAEPTEP